MMADRSNKSHHGLIGGSSAHPRDGNSGVLLDEADVVDGFLGQVFRLGHLGDIALPALQGLIDHLHLGEVVQIAGKTVDQLSVESVGNTHFDLLEAIENIELGQIEGGISVDEIGVSDETEIEPSTTTRASGGGSELVATLSHEFSSGVKQLSGEGSLSDTSSISFCHSNDGFDSLRGDTQTSAHTSNRSGGRGDVGICSEVDIEEGGIGSFNKHSLSVTDVVVDPADRLHDHVVLLQDIGKLAELLQLSRLLSLVVERSHLLVFLDEGVPVDQVTHSQAVSLDLGSIGRSDSLLGRAQVLLGLMSSIFLQLVLGDEMGAIRDEHAVSI